MLGMAMHPDWETTPKVYVVYCAGSSWNGQEYLSVFDWNGTELVNEEFLLTLDAGGIHNGSRLLVLPDNTLLMTAGDVGSIGAFPIDEFPSREDVAVELGRQHSGGQPLPRLVHLHLGQPQQPRTWHWVPNGIIYASEHGQNSNDEFNIVEAGGNYGWPQVEGFCKHSGRRRFLRRKQRD